MFDVVDDDCDGYGSDVEIDVAVAFGVIALLHGDDLDVVNLKRS